MFTPFFTDKERKQHGCQHRLFFSQVEYCDNLIFHRRAAVDELEQRLLDGESRGSLWARTTEENHHDLRAQELQTVIEDLDLPNPMIRSHNGHGFLKQYVRDDRLLRTEPATNSVYDYNVNKDIEHLPALRQKMSGMVDNYHDAQPDILETFVDRGQLRELAEPTVPANGKRIPGLKRTTPGNSRSYPPWCAATTSRRTGPSAPQTSAARRWTHWVVTGLSIRWHRCATTCPN